MKTVCIFGDSIARGRNAPKEEGWAYHLKQFLEERDRDTKVVNLARDGETTRALITYIEKDCEEHKPATVVLAIGVNDCVYSFSDHHQYVPREQFEKNITDILELVKKYAEKIIVLGILRADERDSVISGADGKLYQHQNIWIQKYNDSLKGISQTAGAQFADLYALLTDEELDDGLHPNAAGHQKIWNEIKKLF